MRVYIGHYKLAITAGPKNFSFDLPKNVYKHLKRESNSIIKHNGFLSEKIKNEIRQFCPTVSMETIFMNTGYSKSNLYLTCHKN